MQKNLLTANDLKERNAHDKRVEKKNSGGKRVTETQRAIGAKRENKWESYIDWTHRFSQSYPIHKTHLLSSNSIHSLFLLKISLLKYNWPCVNHIIGQHIYLQ